MKQNVIHKNANLVYFILHGSNYSNDQQKGLKHRMCGDESLSQISVPPNNCDVPHFVLVANTAIS
jgi:hypothetical protein